MTMANATLKTHPSNSLRAKKDDKESFNLESNSITYDSYRLQRKKTQKFNVFLIQT